jgi:hypothetical protein
MKFDVGDKVRCTKVGSWINLGTKSEVSGTPVYGGIYTVEYINAVEENADGVDYAMRLAECPGVKTEEYPEGDIYSTRRFELVEKSK